MSNDKMAVRGGEIAFAPARGGQAMVEAAQSRAAAEIQSAMVIAKRFPRDEAAAWARIQQACRRPTLAERAIYSYPRGDAPVSGPSIRLAEAIAQCWGNLDYGIEEVEQRRGSDGTGESTVQTRCWDLETNSRQTRVFQVRHWRDTKAGGRALESSRDIYEMIANQGARRLRACILGVIPGDVVEGAVRACMETMRSGGTEPIADRVRKMAAAFVDLGITIGMLEQRLQHKLDSTSAQELVDLRGVYGAIRDDEVDRAEFFSPEAVDMKRPAREKPKPAAKPPTPAPRTVDPGAPPWIELLREKQQAYLAAHEGQWPADHPEEITSEKVASEWIAWFDSQAATPACDF